MTTTCIAPGATVRVRVPGSSANLGPGFDSFGLALGVFDEVTVTITEGGLRIRTLGEGAGVVPLDERHLVVRALRRGLDVAGVHAEGLDVTCHNTIPHARGLGSSAAAVAAGLAAADALAGGVLGEDGLVQLAAEFEGHPDNSSASVLGGAVVSWTETGADGGPRYRAARLSLHPDVRATVFIPGRESSTEQTRSILPEVVPHADAAFNAARAGLLALALSTRPDLLLSATEDRLHQVQRAAALPESTALLRLLREAGYAAVVSGAGPCVLVLGTVAVDPGLLEVARADGWRVVEPAIVDGVAVADATSPS